MGLAHHNILGYDKVYDTGRWAHINVKLLHFLNVTAVKTRPYVMQPGPGLYVNNSVDYPCGVFYG